MYDDLVGKRIRLVSMPNDPNPIPPGSEGVVIEAKAFRWGGGFSQLSVKWDDGRTLMLCVPPDRFSMVLP